MLGFLLAALASRAAPLAAQELRSRPIPSRFVEAFTLESPSMSRTFKIEVGLPAGYAANPAKKYPALIVTDGDFVFPIAFDAASSLASGGVNDGLIVVSIGTGLEDGDSTWTRRRVYEFSPPNWVMKDKFGAVVAGLCGAYHVEPGRCTGGAPAFLNAIVTELLPRLTAKYRIDSDQLGLFGVSAGGFFASWAIFQAQSPFKKYIISSPAMAYGDGEIYRQEERWAAEHKDLPVAIYFAAGSLEITDPMLEGTGQIVSGMTRLSAALTARAYPGLKMTVEIHSGLGHGDAAGTTLNRGIRTLYARPVAPVWAK